ncbi:hypothetical protein PV327_001680 [Microctonus hyperodae]|uniref:Gustatory receptor n=1 Tax=Microctonus hyperodae TaxID=165561 RepID=A0AA39FEB6_MICHY|nr:hypothetical protein PV327_001680 [Microctonus hyperodae]
MAAQSTPTGSTRYELEQFSIELLHRNTLFTAREFFSINGGLLQSIIGTTITYMIIIMQYKQSELSS